MAQRVSGPEHVVLLWLPAYSPELNPVERLWEELQSRSAVVEARVRGNRAALQAQVAGLGQRATAAMMASLTGYAYLVEALDALSFQRDGMTVLLYPLCGAGQYQAAKATSDAASDLARSVGHFRKT